MQNVCVGDETDACANSGRLTVNMSMAFDTHGQTKTTSTCFSRTFFGRICFGSVLAVIVQCFFYHSRHIGKVPANVSSTEALATTVANTKKNPRVWTKSSPSKPTNKKRSNIIIALQQIHFVQRWCFFHCCRKIYALPKHNTLRYIYIYIIVICADCY